MNILCHIFVFSNKDIKGNCNMLLNQFHIPIKVITDKNDKIFAEEGIDAKDCNHIVICVQYLTELMA
jgi:hypothetical protein